MSVGTGRIGRWVVGSAVAALLGTGVAAVPVAPAGAQAPGSSPEVLAQIDAIEADKASRTPDELKLDDPLLFTSRRAVGEPPVEGVPSLQTSAETERGLVEVDIDGEVTPDLLAAIDALGGTVEVAIASQDAIRARIPVGAIEPLSGRDDLRHMRVADQFVTSRYSGVGDAIANAGSVTSQADTTHQAAVARTANGVDGTGIQVGVLSDGIATLAARQATGDLPAVAVIPGQAGSGDEGTAMLELVHDLAPGAGLLFATANGGQANFAANIRALRAAGADVIVDDITYFAEAVFQPGTVEQAVDDVVADGAVYFSSIGNSGNVPDGTSGAWTGDFRASTQAGGGGLLHDWSAAAGDQVQNQLTNVNTVDGSVVNLTWSDPMGASGNDYDLYVLNAAGTAVIGSSTALQDGNDNPIEQVAVTANGVRLAVVQVTGAQPRFLSVVTNRARFVPGGSTPGQSFATTGNSYGHNNGKNAISVGATPVSTAINGGSPTGPFPSPHSASNVSELFSSDGPRRNFYLANGTAITPGNFVAGGGELLNKPDITAGDGATTTTPGFIPFFGTSASAPHAAAIAALMLDANPALTPAQVRAAMTSTAIDIEQAGTDVVTGAGIVMAPGAVAAATAVGGSLAFSSATYTVGEAGPTATITVNRTGGSSGAASVTVAAVGGGTATGGGTDYTFTSQSVSWADGDSAAKTVTIPITQDALDEPNETVNLALQSPSGASLGSPSTAVLTITDDDEPPAPTGSLAFSSATYAAGEAGPTATITVNRTGGSSGAASVQVAVTGGTATGGGTDFTYATQTLNWADGDSAAKTTTIAITQDALDEPDETVALALQNATGATLGSPSAATLTITDDDVSAVTGALQFNVAAASTGEGAGTAVLTVNRAGGTTGAGTVQVARTGGTATSGTDFAFTSPTTVTFADGQATASVPVTIVDDGVVDAGETIAFALQNPSPGLTLGSPSSQVLTITDNDSKTAGTLGSVQFAVAGTTIAESGPQALVQVTRTGTTLGTGTVDVIHTFGSATPGSDFTFTSPTTVSFASGQSVATVAVPIVNDAASEPSETVQLTLQAPSARLALGTNAVHTLTITDDDGPPPGQLRFPSAAFAVGEAGPTATITVQRVGGTAGAASVQVAVTGGTATGGGTDFTYATQTVNWANGDDAPKTVSIAITQDAVDEPDETVALALQGATGATLGTPAAATLTITDDDEPAPTVQFGTSSFTVGEAGPTATVTVTRTGSVVDPAAVTVAVVPDGTATGGGVDYTFTSAVASWGPGDGAAKTVAIPITQDSIDEPDETVHLVLQSPTGAVLGFPNSAFLTITDDDSAGTLAFSSPTYTVGEAGPTATITVVRSGGVDGAASVQVAVSGGTATGGGTDFTYTTQTVNWADGDGTPKSVSIAITQDGIDEPDETVALGLQGAAGATVGSPSAATLTITDDDGPPPGPGSLQFGVATSSISETGGTALIAVTRTGGAVGSVSVRVTRTGGTASFGGDFSLPTSGLVTFANGETGSKLVPVTIVNDKLREANETVSFQLQVPSGGAALGAPSTHVLTIVDDESAPAGFVSRI